MDNNCLLIPILVSLLSGFVFLFVPRRLRLFRSVLSLVVLSYLFVVVLQIFLTVLKSEGLVLDLSVMGVNFSFIANLFSSFLLLAVLFFMVLVNVFCLPSRTNPVKDTHFYSYLHWTLFASSIVLLTDNLIMLLVLWGAIAVLLYLMILAGRSGADQAAYKTLVMIGGSDVLMLIGAALVYYLSGTVSLSQIRLPLDSSLAVLAFLLLLIGALTKAGAVPFHAWVVDAAEKAPIPVLALFPGVLDKMLGVYLLARIGLDLFVMIPNSAMSIVLMSIGGLTIVVGSAMALMQKNLLRLLAYSTISQVGYMVLGIGTAIPLAIIGAIFHMVNNTIYKTSLFFTAGAVEARTGQTDFAKLGGLAKFMPIAFITSFIAALAISGIPPLNGFFSKWMIYQGIIEVGKWYFVVFLITAMFGSVLTLAYFLKALHAIFFAPRAQTEKTLSLGEASPTALVPMIILAILAIGFGIYARFPMQIISRFNFGVFVFGFEAYPVMSSGLATVLILAAILIGLVVYLLTRSRQVKSSEVFIGGEHISAEAQLKPGEISQQEATVSGAEFYDSVKEMKLVSETYKVAESKTFDVFEAGKKFFGWLARVGKRVHTGLLQTYLGWIFLGIIAIIAIFFLMLIK